MGKVNDWIGRSSVSDWEISAYFGNESSYLEWDKFHTGMGKDQH